MDKEAEELMKLKSHNETIDPKVLVFMDKEAERLMKLKSHNKTIDSINPQSWFSTLP